MKAVVTRVLRARVEATESDAPDTDADTDEWTEIGSCKSGALILLGVMRGDGVEQVQKLSRRIAQYRFFQGEKGRMDRSLLDIEGEVLVVSQFTLAADGRKGRRPSFDRAAPPEVAEPLYLAFVQELRALGLAVETGRFGARMRVESMNDGPVTLILDEPA